MPNSILITMDFSSYSRAALNYGVILARQFESRLYLFHSVCFPQNMIYGTAESLRGVELNRQVRRVREKMEAFLQGADVDWRPLVGFGNPVEAVNRAAEELDIDLIITASHGMGSLRRMLSGTLVEQFARTADRPLLVIHPAKFRKGRGGRPHPDESGLPYGFQGFQRIVVGCDFKAGSMETVEFAWHLARKVGAECHLIHFLESPVDEDLMETREAAYGELQEMLFQSRHDRLESLLPDTKPEGPPVRTMVMAGLPWEGMVSYTKNRGSDLMVVGLRFHGPLERLLMGSTTDALIRHGSCPVLVIPQGVRWK